MLGESGGYGLSRLPTFVLLLKYADELLSVDVLPGVSVNEVELTSNKLISEVVPRFRQRGGNNAFEEELGDAIVRIAEETELIPAVLKLRDVIRDIVVLRRGGIHERAEMRGEDEVALGFVHRLETSPHALGVRASVSIHFLCSRDVARNEQLGERVVVGPVLSALLIVLRVRAGNTALDILLDVEEFE